MKIQMLRSSVLTDEQSIAAEGISVLNDLEIQKTYAPGDRIMGVSAQPAVSILVEVRGEKYLLPIFFHGLSSLGREMKRKKE